MMMTSKMLHEIPTCYTVRMTEAELGAMNGVLLAYEKAQLIHSIRKLESQILQFIISIHAMRTGERFTKVYLHAYNKVFDCETRDIMYFFTLGDKNAKP